MRRTCLVFAALASAATAFAQSAPASPPADPQAPPLPVVRETVTVVAPAYAAPPAAAAAKTETPLRDTPQSITVVSKELMRDQLMSSLADVVRYVPGVIAHQGENNRDQVIVRGNGSTADFFLDGVRDDAQYLRDVYNLERVEAVKGPNAMLFGRGGGGGLINRVAKTAFFASLHELTLQIGSFGHKRLAADFNQRLSSTLALRVNAMYENSDSFRDHVGLERYGLSPTLTLTKGARTTILLSFERFHDARVADRGVTSIDGVPATPDRSTFFGNPADSRVRAGVNVLSAAVERRFDTWTLRNRTLAGSYDRFYQNFVAGAVTSDRRRVALAAYNNASQRLNLFNQTDLTGRITLAGTRHTILAGAEVGRQATDNFRNTGYFDNTTTSVLVPFTDPTTNVAVTFRQSATDPDNRVVAAAAAVYAQDQVELSRLVQLLGGIRLDRFDLRFHNNRNGEDLGRTDLLVAPRAGVIVKPAAAISLYGSYTVSYLPGSGDQFASLTRVTEQLEPERFHNYELGAKWDVLPALALTAAAYRLDRTNTRATDPNDPGRILQTGSQRTNGCEVGLSGRMTGRWQVAGGYAWQDAFVTSATTAAPAGAKVAQVPRHTLSLWNHWQAHPRVAAGLGIVQRSDMFAAIDNRVTLPGYTRLDAALFVKLTRKTRLQVNVENLADRVYFVNADGNTNISPGAPRTLRVGLMTGF